MSVLTVGVVAESAEGERRVALDPDAVARLVAKNRAVLVERGAGEAARFPDSSYTAAGATIASRRDVLASSDILAVVRPPDDSVVAALHRGQLLIGLLDPLNNLPAITALAAKDVTAASFEFLPRTLSRAQAMDALSSQSSTAGYRAAIVAAENFGRYFPMMITASGTARPAAVIVIGAGVAGLQALATAKRLGAVVTGYDVRAASRGEVESLGAEFMTSSISEGTGTGGYARAMTPEEQAAQQDELATALKKFDVIITTAKVPGHTPPQLVSAATLAAMSPGSVCVDLGASDKGGNVAGSRDGETIVTENGVVAHLLLPDVRQERRRDDRLAHRRRCDRRRPDRRRARRSGRLPRGRDHERTGSYGLGAGSSRTGPPGRGQDAHRTGRLLRVRHGEERMTETLFTNLAVFVLSLLVGFEVISKIPSTLHTPMMSGANAIHGVVVAGAIVTASVAHSPIGYLLTFLAAALASANVFGGYVVTDRMLRMFTKPPSADKQGKVS
jgi:NAD(P) transhydrogenase subunit alpha